MGITGRPEAEITQGTQADVGGENQLVRKRERLKWCQEFYSAIVQMFRYASAVLPAYVESRVSVAYLCMQVT